MSPILIRPLTEPESRAYGARLARCDFTGCTTYPVYIAVYQASGLVERDLLCDLHGSAWAAKHRRALDSAAVTA